MTESIERLKAALSDRYVIERELGSGGMATVFVSKDLKHPRDVAVKVLHPELSASLAAERFLKEIAFTAQLTHPHILTLIDSGPVVVQGAFAADLSETAVGDLLLVPQVGANGAGSDLSLVAKQMVTGNWNGGTGKSTALMQRWKSPTMNWPRPTRSSTSWRPPTSLPV